MAILTGWPIPLSCLQDCNKVNGIRDQGPKKGRDQGSQPWDLESQYTDGESAVYRGSYKVDVFQCIIARLAG